MTTRLKMRVTRLATEEFYGGAGNPNVKQFHIELIPVYEGSPENKRFWDATPDGKLAFTTKNEAAIQMFKSLGEFYVDISRAVPGDAPVARL